MLHQLIVEDGLADHFSKLTCFRLTGKHRVHGLPMPALGQSVVRVGRVGVCLAYVVWIENKDHRGESQPVVLDGII